MIPAHDPDRPSPAEHVRRQVLARGTDAEQTLRQLVEELARAKQLAAELGLDFAAVLIVKGPRQ